MILLTRARGRGHPYADGRRAEATCKAWRACRAPVDRARKSCLRAYLRRPRRRWQAAGRGHPGFGYRDPSDIGAMQRLVDNRTSEPRNATPEQQYLAFQEYDRRLEFQILLAARGLPPDWTEEELERQGYDLWATRPEDVYRGPPPVPDPWRGDGRGVAAAMRAQLESAFREEDESSSEEEEPRTGTHSHLLADINNHPSREAVHQLPIG